MKSMTGYGAAEGKVGKGQVFVELRTVNHRYCDITLKIPPKYFVLDQQFRKVLQKAISRGKVELFLKEKKDVEPGARVVFNAPLARAYERCLREYERTFTGERHQLLDVVDLRELVRSEETPVRYERLWGEIGALCRTALQRLEKMRRAEGSHLLRDQKRRLTGMARLCNQVAAQAARHRKRLQVEFRAAENRAAGGKGNNGHEALQAAVDRIDTTEEHTRLMSHIHQYRQFLSRPGPVGRQIDFLIQEMNREINTIGSKASDARISQLVVEAKSELEKLREQAQNIE